MKITPGSEYFDEVSFAWIPIPFHWIGDDTRAHSHKIRVMPEPKVKDIKVKK